MSWTKDGVDPALPLLRSIIRIAYDYESTGWIDFEFLGHELNTRVIYCGTNAWGEEIAVDRCEVGSLCREFAPDLQVRELDSIIKAIDDYLDEVVAKVCLGPGIPRRAFCAAMRDFRSQTVRRDAA
jgi:hypothetical protein